MAPPGNVVFLQMGVPPPVVVGTLLQSESSTQGSPRRPVTVVVEHAPAEQVCVPEHAAQLAPFFPQSVSSCRKVEMQEPR